MKCLHIQAAGIVGALVLFVGAARPAFGWGEHQRQGELVRGLLKKAFDKPVYSDKELDEFVALYCEYPDWGLGAKRDDALWGYFLDAHRKHKLGTDTHGGRNTV